MRPHYQPTYHGGLTNHITMYEVAMAKLGFDSIVADNLAKTYISDHDIRDLNLESKMTGYEGYLKLVDHYEEELKNQGIQSVVYHYMKDKVHTLQSGLFHGLIRLAYAWMEEDPVELARALAYYDLISQEIRLQARPIDDREMKDAWDKLMTARTHNEILFDHGATAHKVNKVLQEKTLMDLLTEVEVGPETERRMAIIFANWYLKTRDFYVLHVLTGFHALTVLKPLIQDFSPYLQAFWKMAQVHCLITPERLPIIAMETKPWETSLLEAKAMTDPHDVKLYFAAYELYKRYPQNVLMKIGHITAHKYWHRTHGS